MPLRDHFRPPLDDVAPWEGFHGQWPAMLVLALSRKLPRRFAAQPRVHFGTSVEIDVATFETQELDVPAWSGSEGNGGVATVVWAPPRPTLTVACDLPAQDEFEVQVYDTRRGRRLVAAVEIVSPSNKDRPENRRAFVAKCAALLEQQVSVTIVDLVTTRHFNLYSDLLEFIGQADPALGSEAPPLYAVACRGTRKGGAWLLEAWLHPLTVGQPLPTLPLWLADNLSVPLELESSYEETLRILRLA
jgi:hypothetical protein